MRPPPPIGWVCAGSRGWRAARAALAGAAAAAFAAWLVQHLASPQLSSTVGSLIAAVIATICAWRWAEDRTGTLNWTGRAWTWHGTGDRAAVEVSAVITLDLHAALLLRMRPAMATAGTPETIWLVVRRAEDPSRWSQLCATLLAARRAPDESA